MSVCAVELQRAARTLSAPPAYLSHYISVVSSGTLLPGPFGSALLRAGTKYHAASRSWAHVFGEWQSANCSSSLVLSTRAITLAA